MLGILVIRKLELRMLVTGDLESTFGQLLPMMATLVMVLGLVQLNNSWF